MVRETDDLYVKAPPSYFRCPISLEVMKSPVSLCTGVTYDRSSIQRWLDSGNNTCPATMQVLENKDLVPNHTLHRLIQIWLASHSQSQSQSHTTLPPQQAAANKLINQLEAQLIRKTPPNSLILILFLSKLVCFASESEDNSKSVAIMGRRLLPLLAPLLVDQKDFTLFENIILFCNVVLLKGESKFQFGNLKESLIPCLKKGRLELRIAVVKFLDLLGGIGSSSSSSSSVMEEGEIYFSEILRLIVGSSSSWNAEALDASLCLLLRFVAPKKNRSKIVKMGGVRVLTAALSRPELMTSACAAALTEKALKLLEMMSGCKEGRTEICRDKLCLQMIVNKLLKVSNVATEHAVTLLWSLCCLFGDNKKALAAVEESQGMPKILLLLQSNCSPPVRQMCRDLLKCNPPNISCLSCYDTKTTHIMPF